MNELKEHLFCECDECIREYRGPLSNEMRLYYLKSDADKVIAELKRACKDKDDWCLHTLKENRHHKHKRCLAMAMWCKSNSEIYNEFAADASEYMPSYEARFRSKAVLYQKWAMRWLELAKKFKEAK